MAYSGRINYINLADAVETRIKESVQKSNVVSDLNSPSTDTVPSTVLLKQLSDKMDNISNVSITTVGTAPTYDELPTASDNTGKAYVVDGTVYISNGTEWISQGVIKGEQGIQGKDGQGLELSGSYLTVEELPYPNTDGKAYLVNGKIYVYNAEQGVYVDNGNISNYDFPIASADTLGGIKQGTGVEITEDGTLNVTSIPSNTNINIIDFTTTVLNSPIKHYSPSVQLMSSDYIEVFYNGIRLKEGEDWQKEVITSGGNLVIKLLVDESVNDNYNVVYGTIFRKY